MAKHPATTAPQTATGTAGPASQWTQTRRRLKEEQRAFPDTRLGAARSGARFIGSIMSVADFGMSYR